MAKKDKNSFGWSVFRKAAFLGLVVLIGWGLFTQTRDWIRTSSYFRIREIYYDPSLEFLRSSSLLSLKGKNLYSLDLTLVQRQLQGRYPELTNLRLLKRFPDRLLVVAQKRVACAKLAVKNRQVTVDDLGSILSMSATDAALPLISGKNFSGLEPQLGATVKGQEFRTAMKIIKEFRNNADLENYNLARLSIENLSEINFFISKKLQEVRDPLLAQPALPKTAEFPREGMKIIIDTDNIPDKINMLGIVLAQTKGQLEGVKYIDLRFKDALLGKK